MRVVAVAAGLTVVAGAAWYAKAQLMAPQPKAVPRPGSCCEAKEAAVGVDGHMRALLEPLSAQLVLHLRARLASPSAFPRTSASTAQDDDPLRLCGVSDAWIAAVHHLVHRDSGMYATEGSNLEALCY